MSEVSDPRFPLRPTPWLFGVVGALWLFRVLGLAARHKWGSSVHTGDVLSFGWDFGIAVSLLLVSRSSTRPWAPGLPKVRTVLIYVALGVLVGLDLLLRAADVVYCVMTGGHWSSSGFPYITLSNFGLLRDGDMPKLLGAVVGATAVTTLMLVLDGRALRRRATLPRLSARQRTTLAGVAVLALALPMGIGFGATEEQTARFVPEGLFLHEWLVWRDALHDSTLSDLSPTPAVMARFAKAGLVPIKPALSGFPLSRAQTDPTPFPYPKTAAASAGPPNIVFVLVEQLNYEFIHAFSGELPTAMPELSALAERITMVTDYQSVTQPTINALVASLCSAYSAAPYRDLNAGHGSEMLERTPLTCLPEILRDHGYRTVYIQAGSNTFAGTEGFLHAHGFSEIYGMPELTARYPDRETTHWGVHDDTLVAFTEAKIRELEAQRAKDGRPFFVMTQTIDTHSPGHPPTDCPLTSDLKAVTKDGDSRTMLRTLHCTDKALGELGRFIVDDPARGPTTVMAMTGDHPSYAMRFLEDIHRKHGDVFGRWSGRLPLLLHDPLHVLPRRVPVLAGHIDLAPTLLQIIGLGNVPSAMVGFSIFGLRPAFPVLLGRLAPKYVALYEPGRTASTTVSAVAELCHAQKPLMPEDPNALTACEVDEWVRWQDALWKNKRIYPAHQPAHGPPSASR